MALGLDFKSWGALLSVGTEFSEGQGQAKFPEGLHSRGLPCFSPKATLLLIINIANIFDLAEFLIQNDHGPI